MNPCTSDGPLRFLDGVMTAEETGAFERHLEECSACRQRLEHSAGDADTWNSARELLSLCLPQRSDDGGSSDVVERAGAAATVVRSIVAPSDDPAMIGRVGAYEIAGILGRGSTGIVLKGFDRALHRNVAVKILDPSLAHFGAARQRFAREARAMAAVSHEHVTPVYEVNEHAGLPYFVMEYVPGGSLERRLQEEGPLAAISIVRIGLQTAQALAAAHQQGLVHRDIKPANILLDRGADRVRVADFGLARVGGDVTATRSGLIVGTPQYMAPEQVRGELCDARSDLFSLGSVLYALAVGHPPFRADNVYGVMQRIVHDEPRAIAAQNPQIPGWLAGFIRRLMAKEPGERFASASEAASILEGELMHLQNPSSFPAPPRDWLPSASPTRTVALRRWGAAIVATAALVVLARFATPPFFDAQQRRSVENGDAVAPLAASTPLDRPVVVETPSRPLLWNADGFREMTLEAAGVENGWRQGSSRSLDAWTAQRDAAQRLAAELELELTPLSLESE